MHERHSINSTSHSSTSFQEQHMRDSHTALGKAGILKIKYSKQAEQNKRSALVLLSIAMAFFVGIILKEVYLG